MPAPRPATARATLARAALLILAVAGMALVVRTDRPAPLRPPLVPYAALR